MALQVRRVITGHDDKGRAIVQIDEVCKHVASGRPGATACNIWTTEGFPANNDSRAEIRTLRASDFRTIPRAPAETAWDRISSPSCTVRNRTCVASPWDLI